MTLILVNNIGVHRTQNIVHFNLWIIRVDKDETMHSDEI